MSVRQAVYGIALGVVSFLMPQADADTIRMKNGSVLDGTITAQNDDLVVIVLDSGAIIKVHRPDIASMVIDSQQTESGTGGQATKPSGEGIYNIQSGLEQELKLIEKETDEKKKQVSTEIYNAHLAKYETVKKQIEGFQGSIEERILKTLEFASEKYKVTASTAIEDACTGLVKGEGSATGKQVYTAALLGVILQESPYTVLGVIEYKRGNKTLQGIALQSKGKRYILETGYASEKSLLRDLSSHDSARLEISEVTGVLNDKGIWVKPQ